MPTNWDEKGATVDPRSVTPVNGQTGTHGSLSHPNWSGGPLGPPRPYPEGGSHRRSTSRRAGRRFYGIVVSGVLLIGTFAGASVVLERRASPLVVVEAPDVEVCPHPYPALYAGEAEKVPPYPGVELSTDEVPQLERIKRQVEMVRGLEFKAPVKLKASTPRRLADFARNAISNDPASEQSVRLTEDIFEFWGAIPHEVDLVAASTSEKFATAIGGIYVPQHDQLVLIGEAGESSVPPIETSVEVETSLAHELVHALDDQYFDLEALSERFGDPRSGVEELAFEAVVEGSATFYSLEYLRRSRNLGELPVPDLDPSELAGRMDTGLPKPLEYVLAWTYAEGLSFIARVHAARGDAGVNRALVEPPRSSYEIENPEIYLEGRSPVPPAQPRVVAAIERHLGERWAVLRQGILGPASLRALSMDKLSESERALITERWAGASFKYIGCEDRRVAMLIQRAAPDRGEQGKSELERAWRNFAASWKPQRAPDASAVPASWAVGLSGDHVVVILASGLDADRILEWARN